MKKHNLLIVLVLLIIVALLAYYNAPVTDSLPTISLNNVIWKVRFSENELLVSQPQINDGNLYVQTKTEISVYSISTGKIVWKSKIPLEESLFGSTKPIPILINHSRVIVQSQRTMVSSFDKETGILVWNKNDPSTIPFIKDMSLQGGKVIVSSYGSNISAYNTIDGKILWLNGDVPSRTELNLFSFDKKIILGSLNTLVSYNTENGQKIKSYELNGNVDSYSLDRDHLYMIFDDGECVFASFSLKSMKNDWCVTISYNFLLNNMDIVYDNENLYFFGTKMYGVNKKTGNILWELEPLDFFKNPVLIGDFIYVTDSDYLYKINKNTGSKVAKVLTNASKFTWAPITTPDLILVLYKTGVIAYRNPFK